MRNIVNHIVRPVDLLLSFVSVVCNTLVFITVARTKSLQRPPFLMLCSLSATELTNSLFSIFVNIETLTHEHKCPNRSAEKTGLAVLCSLATLAMLAVISRDRYLAVRKPLWYRNHATKSRAFKVICASWLITVATVFVYYLQYKLEGGNKPF